MTSRWSIAIGALAWALSIAGCAWERPKVDPPPASDGQPVVVGAGGPLSAARSEDVVEDAVAQARYRERAAQLVDAVQAATRTPLIAGNRTRLLIDGPSTYAAMFAAVRAARHHVDVETYIFDDGDTARRFAALLADKQREGVQVRVIYDAIGGSEAADIFTELQAQGVQTVAFRPIDPVRLWRVNNRDHRKMVIVDGQVAFTGGINISETYASSSATRPGPERGVESGWRDTHVEVHGPAVQALETIFLRSWRRLGKPMPEAAHPRPQTAGDVLMQVVASDGGDGEYRIYDAYMTAISHATQRIWIETAYFSPDADFRRALRDAVARGVDVRVVVPSFSDIPIVFQASHRLYEELLDGGVKLFEFEDAMLHAKTAVVDGVWSTIGSCNLDPRSFAHNNELNVVVVGRDFGRSMEATFQADLGRTRPVDAATWSRRPVRAKMKEWMAGLLAYWL
jgi:cardiolipin synthase